MKVFDFEQFQKNEDFFLENGNKIFIYPTDTIYGLGSIVSPESVQKIYEIKKRDIKKPFSIIAPNVDWIIKNFEVSDNFENELNEFLNKYHGITLLLNKKNKDFLSELGNLSKLGVRILKHPFQSFVAKLGKPFISTSVNFAGQSSAIQVKDINPEILSQIDLVIDGGKTFGKPSVLIDYSGDKVTIRG